MLRNSTRFLILILALALLQSPLKSLTYALDHCEGQELDSPSGQTSDRFGQYVAIHNDTAVVGAFSQSPSGAAYVFRLVDGDWVQVQELTDSNDVDSDFFGQSVAVHGDRIVIGAPGDDENGSNAGAAYVYRYLRDREVWVEEAKLVASNGTADSVFGHDVALDNEGIIVGAPAHDGVGAAYVFDFDEAEEVWSESQEITASDPAALDRFGREVSIQDGVAVVTADSAVYVFRHDGVEWTEEGLLTEYDGQPFAPPTTVDATEGCILVGTQNADSAYVFRYDGLNWTEEHALDYSGVIDRFGTSVAVTQTLASVTGEAGAYLFRLVGSTWTQVVATEPTELDEDEEFGFQVDIDGTSVIVAAPDFDDFDGVNNGSANIFACSLDASYAQFRNDQSPVQGLDYTLETNEDHCSTVVNVGDPTNTVTFAMQSGLPATATATTALNFGGNVGLAGPGETAGLGSCSPTLPPF